MFGLFTHASRWGVKELKNDLRVHLGLSTQFDKQMQEDILNDNVRGVLNFVFMNNCSKFSTTEKATLQNMFDSQCAPNDIENYFRAKLGKNYDTDVKRNLDKYYKWDEAVRSGDTINDVDKKFGYLFNKDQKDKKDHKDQIRTLLQELQSGEIEKLEREFIQISEKA